MSSPTAEEVVETAIKLRSLIRQSNPCIDAQCHAAGSQCECALCLADSLGRRITELEDSARQNAEALADADLLFGAGWQESLKAVNGDPHQAIHAQCAKLAAENAEQAEALAAERDIVTAARHLVKCYQTEGNGVGVRAAEDRLIAVVERATPATSGDQR